jgi:hypothetical protein
VSETSSDFQKALVELIDSTGPEPADHPSHERWIAYQRGELPADEEARLAEHLVRCRDCFDLAQAADALFGPESEPGEALASAAIWRLLRPQLETAPERPQSPAGRTRDPASRARFPYALAASLFLAVLGLTGWNLAQRSALSALRAPKPDAPIIEFSAGERLPASGEKTLTAGSGPWMFVFHPADELPAYRLAIRDAETGRELSSHPLRPDADLALTLQLPEGLPPGRYRLELQDGSREGSGKPLETHLLRVMTAGPGG